MLLLFELISCRLGFSSDRLVWSFCGALFPALTSRFEYHCKVGVSFSEQESESKTILILEIKIQFY